MHIRLAPSTQGYKKIRENPRFENLDRAVQNTKVAAWARSASRHLTTIEINLTPHAADATYLQTDSGAAGIDNHDDFCLAKPATQSDKASASYEMVDSTFQPGRPSRAGSKRRSAACIQCVWPRIPYSVLQILPDFASISVVSPCRFPQEVRRKNPGRDLGGGQPSLSLATTQ